MPSLMKKLISHRLFIRKLRCRNMRLVRILKNILGNKEMSVIRQLMRLARKLMAASLPQHEYRKLTSLIISGGDLASDQVRLLAESVEQTLLDPSADKVGIHRKIGEAIFTRSTELYSGHGLPKYLVRYTYPPVISIALNSQCNAACFFCREDDYKGDSIDFDNVVKLESAISNARTIDLTGWGEPFLYPRLSEIVSYVCSINNTKHLLQFTSNRSLLSEKWGKMLSGKLSSFIISLNAATPNTYSAQMRYKSKHVTFESTLANIRAFQAQLTDEDRRRITLHMVANAGNYHELTAMVKLAAEMRIPVVNIGHYICAQEEHRDKTLWNVRVEYNTELEQAKIAGKELGVNVCGRQFFLDEDDIEGAEHCMAPFEQFFIEMPGTTAPCCFMGHERMGNVYQLGFEAVWFSELMNKLRKKRFLPPCQVCVSFTSLDKEAAHISATLLTTRLGGV